MNTANPSRQRLNSALFIAALLPLLLSVYVHFMSAGTSGAKDWLLYAARMMLSGRKLYVDIIEVNPPLILWIDAIPVWIAQHESFFSDSTVLVLSGFASVALSIAVCMRLLLVHPAFAENPVKQAWFALLLAYIFIYFTVPAYFFDREHIMMLMVLPYLLRFMPSLSYIRYSRGVSALVGVMGAVGFCMKPHAAILFVLLQLFYFWRERSTRIALSLENLIIYALGALYLLCIWQFAREYVTLVMPMALPTYGLYARPKGDRLYFLAPIIVLLALTFIDFRKHASPFRKDIPYFLILGVVFLLYALMNNGWGYTYSPLIDCTLLLTGWVWMEYRYLREDFASRGMFVKQFTFGARSCAIGMGTGAVFLLMFFFTYLFSFNCGQDDACHTSSTFLEQARKYPKRSFSTFSTGYDPWLALVSMTHTSFDSRFGGVLWMLPRFMRHNEAFNREHHWILEYVSKSYGEDLDRYKPDTVFVDTSPLLFSSATDIDMVDFMSITPEFRAAWTHYKLVGTINTCAPPKPDNPKDKGTVSDCRYAVYQRVN